MRIRPIQWRTGIVAGALALGVTAIWGTAGAHDDERRERFLYVWAGDQARTAPDRLAVVDFNPASDDYGRVITTRPLPGPGAAGNEPHHVGLSSDGRTLALGGLLSVLKGQPEIFFFDVSKPAVPRFLSSVDPPQSAITDEFYAIPGGGYLVTMMGGPQGHHPGRVVEFDRKLRLVAEHPGTAARRRLQPAWDLGPARTESDGDQRLHLSVDDAPCRAGRPRSARQHPGVGAVVAEDQEDDSGAWRRRHDRREADSRRSPRPRLHGGHAGRPAVSRRAEGGQGDARCSISRPSRRAAGRS